MVDSTVSRLDFGGTSAVGLVRKGSAASSRRAAWMCAKEPAPVIGWRVTVAITSVILQPIASAARGLGSSALS